MKPLVHGPKIIAVVGMSLHGQDAGILRGIARYAQNRNWRVQICGSQERDFRDLEQNFEIQGIIAHVFDMEMVRDFQTHDVPVINISGTRPEAFPFPYVNFDMKQVGDLAADYFLQKGYRHFAVEAAPGRFNDHFIVQGSEQFCRQIRAKGYTCFELEESLYFSRLEKGSAPDPHPDLPLSSLETLPRPAAIFVLGDRLATRLCGLCQEKGISVPEELAILSYGNFELVCETAYPPVSSIATPDEELGHTAAHLLHQLLLGKTLREKKHLIPPAGILSRRSTDALAIEDLAVAKAVHFIRQSDLREIDCDQVALASGINRRTLERKFRSVLGRSLYGEIQHWRTDRAKHLLQHTLQPLKNVASEAGFRDADHMSKVLRSTLGQTPRQLRKQNHQLHPG